MPKPNKIKHEYLCGKCGDNHRENTRGFRLIIWDIGNCGLCGQRGNITHRRSFGIGEQLPVKRTTSDLLTT